MSFTDNKPAEHEAEFLIHSRLLKHNFNVTKPSFDKKGADLLIVDNIEGNLTKFLIIQSKLRTVSSTKNNSVEIPIEYVKSNFVFFLYVNRGDEKETLYTFFEEDITRWRSTNANYVLNLSEKTLLMQSKFIFDKKIVEKLQLRLNAQPIKKYTSMIIDGIFLEKAIKETEIIYANIWPDKKFLVPHIKDLITNFIYSIPFEQSPQDINCILYLSEHHNLETTVDFSGLNLFTPIEGVKLSLNKSGKIICFEVLSELERIINAENVILVADDPAYESELKRIAEDGIDLVVYKMKHDSGSQMYTTLRYLDITHPLGKSIGLKNYEL